MAFHSVLWFFIAYCILDACGSLILSPEIGPVKTIVLHSSYAVTCFGDSQGDAASQLQWLKKPNHVITSTHKRIFTNDRINVGNRGGNMLFFNDVQESDAAVYLCRNSTSNESISFELLFHEPVVFEGTPLVQSGKAGENMTIRCDATGKPAPSFSWRGPDQRSIADSDKFKLLGDGLEIFGLTVEDAGTYLCIALQSGIEDFKSVAIRLDVEYKPEWSESDAREVVFKTAASTAALSCKAKGSPEPSITWYLDEMVISENVDVLYVNSTGSYQCKVNNTLGEIHRNFTVKEGHLPGKPNNVKSHNVTSNSLSVGFSPPAKTPHSITGYRVEIFSKQGSHRKHVNISGDPSIVTLSDLQPNTEYVIRLAAVNEVGLGESWEIQTRTRSSSAGIFHHFSVLLLVFAIVASQC